MSRRIPELLLGVAMWVVVGVGFARAVQTVFDRTAVPGIDLFLDVEPGHRLRPGDPVYLAGREGLEPIGEVARVLPGGRRVQLAIVSQQAGRVNQSSEATCWQTPLSAQQAVEALLPPTIQDLAAQEIALSWQQNDEALSAAWEPLMRDVVDGFLPIAGAALKEALERREERVAAIVRSHGRAVVEEWPTISSRLLPILHEHITPLLMPLVVDAILAAPKLGLAADLARGRTHEASRRLADWFAMHVSSLPEEDLVALNMATGNAWDATCGDPVLLESLSRLARGVLEDAELRQLLAEVYREAIVDNPRTQEYVRQRILDTPRFRDRLYDSFELFGPAARKVAALCLLKADGATRPEIVHLVRSVAFRRSVAWVTLTTASPDAAPLDPAAILPGRLAGGGR